MTDQLFSVYNVSKGDWATITNFSTREEAEDLMDSITRQIKSWTYEVREVPHKELARGYNRFSR